MIITLCGSARFEQQFKNWNEILTLAGHTVFSLSVYPSDKAGEKNWYTPEEKLILDQAHFKKIDASQAIFVLNKYAYIGESTLNEIEYAKISNKIIYALESWGKGNGIFDGHTKDVQQDLTNYGLTCPTFSPIDTFASSTTGFTCPYMSNLLGPSGSHRSRLVQLIDKDRKVSPVQI